jgi:hypothetical protein
LSGVILTITLAGPAFAELVPHGPYPAWYFFDNGTPSLGLPYAGVLLNGYGSVVVAEPTLDYRLRIPELKANNVSYARVWHMTGAIGLRPWRATGPSTLDYAQWNDSPIAQSAACTAAPLPPGQVGNTYWERLRDAMTIANQQGLIVSIHLFDRGGKGWMPDGTVSPTSFYSDPTWRSRQDAYVSKLIAETAACPFVVYEIENEPQGGGLGPWHDYWAQSVKAQLVGRTPKIVSGSAPHAGSLSNLDLLTYHPTSNGFRNWDALDMTCTTLGRNCVLPYLNQERTIARDTLSRGRALSVDEYGNGLGEQAGQFPLSLSDSGDLLRMLSWTYLASGAHIHIEDAVQSIAFGVMSGIKNFLASWDFKRAVPTDATTVRVLTSSGAFLNVQASCMHSTFSTSTRMCYVPTLPAQATAVSVEGLTSSTFGWWYLNIWDPRAGQWATPVNSEASTSTATTLQMNLPSLPPSASKRDVVLLLNDNRSGPAWSLSALAVGSGDGGVTSWPAAINCGTSAPGCTAAFGPGGPATLVATAQPGSTFSGWSGACSGSSQTCQVAGGSNKSVTANFTFTATVMGVVDGVYLNGGQSRLSGWACAVGWPSSIPVHVYRGGAAGSGGTFLTAAMASVASEPGVAAACQSTGSAYRFSIPLDSWSSQHHGETLWVHGISPFGRPNNAIVNSGAFRIPGANTIVGSSATSCNNGCGGSWGNARAIDGAASTAWSSAFHSSADAYEAFAVSFDGVRNVDYVRITPRVYGGTNRCVPEFVNVYALVNGQWAHVVTANLPADIPQSGYSITFPNRAASSLLIDTNRLRYDGAGGYYFQIAEVGAGTGPR